jgi:hypothetical protein
VPSGFGAKSTGACGSRAGAVVVVVVGAAVVVVVGAWAVAVVEDVGAWTRWVVAVAVLPGALRPVLDVVAASVDEVVSSTGGGVALSPADGRWPAVTSTLGLPSPRYTTTPAVTVSTTANATPARRGHRRPAAAALFATRTPQE